MDARWDPPYTAADVGRANDRVGSLFSGTGFRPGVGAEPGGELEIGANFEGRRQHELQPWGHSTGPVPARWKELDPGQQIRYSLPGKAGIEGALRWEGDALVLPKARGEWKLKRY